MQINAIGQWRVMVGYVPLSQN